jgi:hypothetical protein
MMERRWVKEEACCHGDRSALRAVEAQRQKAKQSFEKGDYLTGHRATQNPRVQLSESGERFAM